VKRNLLQVLLKNTVPVSREEFKQYIELRHGGVVRENASADLTALDSAGLAALEADAKKSQQAISKSVKPKMASGSAMSSNSAGTSPPPSEKVVAGASPPQKRMAGRAR
jgi:hypothetical protein